MSGSRISGTMFDQGSPIVNQAAGEAGTGEILVVLYLRGGLDGLNFVPPVDGPNVGFMSLFGRRSRFQRQEKMLRSH